MSHTTVISTDVVFEESVFPLKTPKPPPMQPSFTPEHPPTQEPDLVNLVLPDLDDEDDISPAPLAPTQGPVTLPSPPPISPPQGHAPGPSTQPP